MPSPTHLQIFDSNDLEGRSKQPFSSQFSQFSQLPKELRLQIWRLALQQHRLIQVELHPPALQPGRDRKYVEVNTRHGERYAATVAGAGTCSKLLRVNCESRQEAQAFHRVTFPCLLKKIVDDEEAFQTGGLSFNPEWDFLFICKSFCSAEDTLIDFIYHLKNTYDPRHVGLVNLAIDHQFFCGMDLNSLQPSTLPPAVRSTFTSTLEQLREVFFVIIRVEARQYLGITSGLFLNLNETQFNRSMPTIAGTPTFRRIQRDPRPIAQDLASVIVRGPTLGSLPAQWFEFILSKFDVSPPHVQYRYLLASEPRGRYRDPIADRITAIAHVDKEEARWNDTSSWPPGSHPEVQRNENLRKAVRPAFGFWLFPVDAFASKSRENGDDSIDERQLWDLSNTWPELGLVDLY